jgi:hypothetical protein
MREGFDENGEPTLTKIDDYLGKESKEKKDAIKWVIISGLILGVVFTAARLYFWDKGEPDLNTDDKIVIKHY